MNTGWICPKCGRVYAPLQFQCLLCNQAINNNNSINNNNFSAITNDDKKGNEFLEKIKSETISVQTFICDEKKEEL